MDHDGFGAQMIDLEIRDDMIRLGQALKLAGVVEDGAQAREAIEAGDVAVNGVVETRRGRQLHVNDVIRIGDEHLRIARS